MSHLHTGEMVDTETTDWWCPTEERWVMCPGPCPDGTEHTETKVYTMQSELIKILR